MEKVNRAYLKKIRELLRDKKRRDEECLFVVEGAKITRDMIDKGYNPVSITVSDSFAKKNETFVEYAENRNINVFHTADRDFIRISTLKHPEGVFSIMRKPSSEIHSSDISNESVILFLDNVQNPGNLGTMIRIASAFGADAVAIYGWCADVFSPKTIRASAGTAVIMPVCRMDIAQIDALRARGMKLFAGTSQRDVGTTLTEMTDGRMAGIFVFGSEGKGLSPEVSDRMDGFFRIPIEEGVESLNVAAAAAITLYELKRKG